MGLPSISIKKVSELLKKVKPSVNDIFSITARHYLNGGKEALVHLHFILNAIIDNIPNAEIPEINTVHAHILYKGHKKDRNVDSSYRTISTCPFIAKCLDSYIRDLSSDDWDAVKAETQFQGKNLSHEHSAILLTECIQHSKFDLKKPIFALYLDAKSAFDKALFEVPGRRLYLDGTQNKKLSFILQRIENRITFCEWDKTLMGPIHDELGVEQGGVNSSDFYKILNNEQLSVPQETNFGVNFGGSDDIHVASIGQADDTVLISHNLVKLKFLLKLTLNYCQKYHVELSAPKTQLQVYLPPGLTKHEDIYKHSIDIRFNDTPINFVESAEHVGVIRSVQGNLPHILNRISSHNKALHSVLPVGLARNQRGNPAASLRVEKLYGVPVLLSGTASLILKQTEINILSTHFKKKIESLQKLHERTPDPVVYFLSGCLPASALLHLRQFSIFSMIARLPNNILNRIARHILLTSKDSSKSWFIQVKKLFLQYQLPHPLSLLDRPLSKHSAKCMFKNHVIDYWQSKFRRDVLPMSSLRYFKPEYMSLQKTHPIWSTCGSNSYEVCKAIVHAKMLSGRYRTDLLVQHFNNIDDNDGLCKLCPQKTPGDIEHLLVLCPALEETRDQLHSKMINNSSISDTAKSLITQSYTSMKNTTQMMLDCSTIPSVIVAKQREGSSLIEQLFRISRSWCYAMHKARLKLLGRWTN